MKYTAAVTWWEYHEGTKKPRRVDNICFAGISLCEKVKYIAHARNLTKEEAKFYIEFLGESFGFIHKFNANQVVHDELPMVRWTIESKGLNSAGLLLYLTAFRATAEQPHQIKYIYERREGKTHLELWNLFHEAHVKVGLANSHHALMAPGNYGSSNVPVDLEVFRERVRKQTPGTVFGYFA